MSNATLTHFYEPPYFDLFEVARVQMNKKNTSLCNTDAKPNINVNVSGQRVHQHRALADSGSLGWS